MTDIIGDIHGHADKLKELLLKSGYTNDNEKGFCHPRRKVLFIGDYIDRGPKIPETLKIVKQMADNGNAIALMGNHEYNAICFHTKSREGGYLREHSIKNILQHKETLKQFHNKQEEYDSYIEWFKTLPLFYETNEFRAVHACWDSNHIQNLQEKLTVNKLDNDTLHKSVYEKPGLYNIIDHTLKGKELKLPGGATFTDTDGTIRKEIRIKWWENPEKQTYRSISVTNIDDIKSKRLDDDISDVLDKNYYTETEKPVFFGHYWLEGKPWLFRNNVCCLDYSVAKGGKLAAYRFNGEEILDSNNFTFS
ncbi:MAG: metallophosphoesterase [Ignavibacteriae bacterium]|nr:metallophosphoesterase [Ignavibacteriota bacterium]